MDLDGGLPRLTSQPYGQLAGNEQVESLVDHGREFVRSVGIPRSMALKMRLTSLMPIPTIVCPW